jgi:hypothetical protein
MCLRTVGVQEKDAVGRGGWGAELYPGHDYSIFRKNLKCLRKHAITVLAFTDRIIVKIAMITSFPVTRN